MTDQMKQALTTGGIRVDEVLERFLGNEELLQKMLEKFLEDDNFQNLRLALEKGDRETAFRSAHTLKGVSGNMSMERLFPLVSEQVERLRRGELMAAAAEMPRISREYETVCGAIRRCLQ